MTTDTACEIIRLFAQHALQAYHDWGTDCVWVDMAWDSDQPMESMPVFSYADALDLLGN